MPERPGLSSSSCSPRYSPLAYVRDRLREARGNVTQAEVARRMGVTQTAISYWESGQRDIGLDELADFALATCKPVEFFLPPPQPEGDSQPTDDWVAGFEAAMDRVRDLTMKIPVGGHR